MFKVELFSESSATHLQDAINRWLATHREATIMQSGLSTRAEDIDKGLVFYILYTTPDAQAEALKELAAEVTPESSVEATDINPEVLKPTS